jgi:heme-degrading monooxygenase HmoA
MSVIVIMKVPGDTNAFREFFESHKHEMDEISEKARDMGCLAHTFTQGENVTVAVDHWESAEAFEKFSSMPEIAETMASAGASGPPTIEIYEVIDTVESF